MTTLRSPDLGRRRGGVTAWWALSLLAIAALGYTTWRVLGSTPYHIDIDVYRMAAQAWRDGKPLYGDDWFHTQIDGTVLPFTYPPIAAVLFAPLTWVPLGTATAALTVISTALLVVSVTIVLSGLGVTVGPAAGCGPLWWRRGITAAAIVAAGIWCGAEPVWANFDFGQINAVLMTLVLLDCVPRRTRWPRGALLGVAVALKLTPAVFLLYFLLRRDIRAALTTVVSFLAATGVGFLLAWHDSWQYWTHTIGNTDRIGGAALNTNQNLAGALARLPLSDGQRSALWVAGSVLVLLLTVWAVRRVLATDDQPGAPVLALICVALFGLVVSPVSWSHHWVWMVPTVVVTVVLAWRRRAVVLGALGVAGAALMVRSPIVLLPEHHEAAATWWRQLAGASYVWWALAVIIAAGTLKPPAAD